MKDIAVIGCGQFGSSVALTLSELGHDVLVICLLYTSRCV